LQLGIQSRLPAQSLSGTIRTNQGPKSGGKGEVRFSEK
jgi:hypothetical protein